MAELDPKSAPLSADGELVGSFFCVYCGELNPIGVMICQSCRRYIADQGPDLSARLQRIMRYASSVHQVDQASQPDLIGGSVGVSDSVIYESSADECKDDIILHYVDIAPIMERISNVASHISPTPRPLGLELAGHLVWWIALFLAFIVTFIILIAFVTQFQTLGVVPPDRLF
jgi:hypothetical protein